MKVQYIYFSQNHSKSYMTAYQIGQSFLKALMWWQDISVTTPQIKFFAFELTVAFPMVSSETCTLMKVPCFGQQSKAFKILLDLFYKNEQQFYDAKWNHNFKNMNRSKVARKCRCVPTTPQIQLWKEHWRIKHLFSKTCRLNQLHKKITPLKCSFSQHQKDKKSRINESTVFAELITCRQSLVSLL